MAAPLRKLCRRCNVSKSRDLFSRRAQATDGLQAWCKDCRRERYHENRAAEISNAKRHAIANPEKVREAKRRWRAKNPRYQYLDDDPIKVSARRQVYNAVSRGDLVRPSYCTRCGAACKPEGHHPDYAKPLDVVWLCRQCHGKEHAEHSP